MHTKVTIGARRWTRNDLEQQTSAMDLDTANGEALKQGAWPLIKRYIAEIVNLCLKKRPQEQTSSFSYPVVCQA